MDLPGIQHSSYCLHRGRIAEYRTPFLWYLRMNPNRMKHAESYLHSRQVRAVE